jgi:large subunit ribosomal protein L17
MRHQVKGSKLGRTSAHKKATMRSLSISLLTHNRIVTTLAKAKELRRYVEPLINRAKEDTMHNRRQVFSFLQDNVTTSRLFDEIGPKVGDRPGGFTRVIRVGYRMGDSADRAVIELVDYNDVKPGDVARKKKRTRRGAAKPKAETAAEVAPVVAAPVVAEDTVEAVDLVGTVDASEIESTDASEATAPHAVEDGSDEKKD